jgi:AcrR family transcriptional regulator
MSVRPTRRANRSAVSLRPDVAAGHVTVATLEPRMRQIVNEAARLFNRHGYHLVTMDDIATAVGLQKPSLYHYVRSKDEILALIHRELIDVAVSRLRQRTTKKLSPEERLHAIMTDLLELNATHPGHVRVFFEHHRELPLREQRSIREERDAYAELVEAAIRDGIAAGRFRRVNARIATFAFFGMSNWAYQWFQSAGPLRANEIADIFAELLLNGLRKR